MELISNSQYCSRIVLMKYTTIACVTVMSWKHEESKLGYYQRWSFEIEYVHHICQLISTQICAINEAPQWEVIHDSNKWIYVFIVRNFLPRIWSISSIAYTYSSIFHNSSINARKKIKKDKESVTRVLWKSYDSMNVCQHGGVTKLLYSFGGPRRIWDSKRMMGFEHFREWLGFTGVSFGDKEKWNWRRNASIPSLYHVWFHCASMDVPRFAMALRHLLSRIIILDNCGYGYGHAHGLHLRLR